MPEKDRSVMRECHHNGGRGCQLCSLMNSPATLYETVADQVLTTGRAEVDMGGGLVMVVEWE